MLEISTPQKEMSAPTHRAPNPDGNGLVSTTQHEGDYTMNPNLQFALELAQRGWYVFPCRERREETSGKTREIKSPYTPHGKNDATTDPEIICAWWKHWPDALIGIYCEKSGFFPVDVDDKNGKNGFRSWENLVEVYGGGKPVNVGPVQDTPNGGSHLLFKIPEGLVIPNNADKLGDGLDLRSNGYICTRTGYSWLHAHGPDTPLTDAPTWLLDIIRNLGNHQLTRVQPKNHTQLTERWLKQAIFRANIGNRNDTGFWQACQLRDAGFPSTAAEDAPFPESVPQSSGQAYSRREWIASVRSAYSQAPRSPVPGNGSSSHSSPPTLPIMPLVDFPPDETETDDHPLPLASYVPDLPPSARLPDGLMDTSTLDREIEDIKKGLAENDKAIRNLLDLAETFGALSAGERLREREGERVRLNLSLQEAEAKRKTAEVELAPDALAIAPDAWRRHLVEAQQKEDILGMKYFLTRFVSKIEVDYHTARLFYTYPIDDLNSLMHDVMSWGHHENSELTSEFSLL